MSEEDSSTKIESHKIIGTSGREHPCFLQLVITCLPSIHRLGWNSLGDEGAHIISVAMKTMKNLQHLQ